MFTVQRTRSVTPLKPTPGHVSTLISPHCSLRLVGPVSLNNVHKEGLKQHHFISLTPPLSPLSTGFRMTGVYICGCSIIYVLLCHIYWWGVCRPSCFHRAQDCLSLGFCFDPDLSLGCLLLHIICLLLHIISYAVIAYHMPVIAYHMPVIAYHMPLIAYHMPVIAYHIHFYTWLVKFTWKKK